MGFVITGIALGQLGFKALALIEWVIELAKGISHFPAVYAAFKAALKSGGSTQEAAEKLEQQITQNVAQMEEFAGF